MEYNRKAAPQRKVLEIIKAGEWSKVQYLHKLECGHIETRKRAASTEKLSCLGCVQAEQAEKVLASLARPTIVEPPIEEVWRDDIAEDVAYTEQQIGFTRAGIANHLGIPAESVDVVMEQDEDGVHLSYVVVFLDADTARRMATNSNNVIDI
jgi:hypothetical protein